MVKQLVLTGLAAMAMVGCQVATHTAASVPVAKQALLSVPDALALADTFFLTQTKSAKYNPNQPGGSNANCGPASLSMALRAFGKAPRGLESPATAHELVKYVRKAMTGEVDEQSWTYPSQVEQGARDLGLKANIVFGADKVLEAMAEPGHLVVVNVNPTPAYVDQLTDDYDGGHFALVTAVDGQRICLDDPLAPHPITISKAQLQQALTTSLGTDPYGKLVPAYDGGVALSL